mgnify:CR=1 FL=1
MGFEQSYPLMDFIFTIAAGIAGLSLVCTHKLRHNQDAFLVLVFAAVFTGVVSIALGPFPLCFAAAAAGAAFGGSLLGIEWLMPIPTRPSSDDEDNPE